MDPSEAWINGVPYPVTVCDRRGVVVFMNEAAGRWYERFGGTGVIGSNLLDCHPEPARSLVASMLGTAACRAYTIDRGGTRYMVYHTAWYHEGELGGLVELILALASSGDGHEAHA